MKNGRSVRMNGVRAAVFALLPVLGFGCMKGVVETPAGAAAGSRTILIAAYPTEYKNRVAQGLANRYRDRATVTLVTIQDLKSIDHRKYDALVLIDQLMAWQVFNFESRGFIGSLGEPEARRKLVLYLTAGSPKENYRFQGIDAMTGATAMNREGDAIEAISGRIDAVLATP